METNAKKILIPIISDTKLSTPFNSLPTLSMLILFLLMVIIDIPCSFQFNKSFGFSGALLACWINISVFLLHLCNFSHHFHLLCVSFLHWYSLFSCLGETVLKHLPVFLSSSILQSCHQWDPTYQFPIQKSVLLPITTLSHGHHRQHQRKLSYLQSTVPCLSRRSRRALSVASPSKQLC